MLILINYAYNIFLKIYKKILKMESNQVYKSMIDMGCNPTLSEAAIRKLNTEDLGALLDWVTEHCE